MRPVTSRYSGTITGCGPVTVTSVAAGAATAAGAAGRPQPTPATS